MGLIKFTDDELLEHLSELIAKYGSTLTRRHFEGLPEREYGWSTYKQRFGSWNQAKELALIYEAKSKKAKPKKGDIVKKKFDRESGTVTTVSGRIKTLEEALTKGEVDINQWEVERYVINSWEVGAKLPSGTVVVEPLWQVKVWLKRRVPDVTDLAIRNLIKDIPKWKPVKPRKRLPESDFALEMALFDAHFGKLAWKKEVEQGDYDLDIAEQFYMESAEQNLTHAGNYPISKIFYILGQDLMHVENYQGQTPIGGHKLDVDSRLPKVYTVAKRAVLRSIEMCLEVAPVEVLWIPGNHDMHASFYLSEVVKERFRDDKFVTVDNSPPWRKARLWGNLLVAYTHDASRRTVSIVNMLPQFWPELWGKSKFREWHVGHKHKKEELKFHPTLTVGGVIIRQIPTLSTIDAWHYQEGFVDAVPAGESFIWTKDHGICGQYTAYVGE